MSYGSELAAIAVSYVDCSARLEPQRFADLVAPDGPASSRTFFLTPNVPGDANSTCGTGAVGFLRLLLQAHGRRDLDGPLELDWWDRTKALARAHGALRSTGRPPTGSIVHVESHDGRHWFVIVEQLDGVKVATVDGGQKDRGYQAIRKMTRQIPPAGILELVSGKPIVDWIDVDALMKSLLGAPPGTSPTAISSPPTAPSTMSLGGLVVVDGPSIQGIDVSGHNVVDSWRAVAGDGIKLACVKLGDGSSLKPPYEDGAAAMHLAGARSVGLEVQGYHFLRGRPGGPQDGEQQGHDYVRVYRMEGLTTPPVVDLERATNERCTAHELLEALGGWLQVVQTEIRGPWWDPVLEDFTDAPWIYCGPGHIESLRIAAGALALATYPLWVSDMEPSRSSPMLPRPWTAWRAWQYAGGGLASFTGRLGRVAGIRGDVDRSIIRGTRADLRPRP